MLLASLIEQLDSSVRSSGDLIDEETMLDLVRALTAQMKSDCHRSHIQKIPINVYVTMEKIMERTKKDDLIMECFRCLRNSVAFSLANQNLVRTTTQIIQLTKRLLLNHVRGETSIQLNMDEDEGRDQMSIKLNTDTARVALQFLTNSIIGNRFNAQLVQTDGISYIFQLLERNVNEAGFLTNTLLNIIPEFSKQITEREFQILLNDLESEATLLCLETLASNTEFLQTTYKNLTPEQRLQYIDILNSSPCKKSLLFFSAEFRSKADLILKSDLTRIEKEFQEILQLTCLVSNFNDMEEIKLLQNDSALVTTVIHLFQMTKSHKMFEPIEKLTKFSKEEQDHPTFMFKAHLVRLLGNLAYGHTENQNQIGITCLIQILSTTKIDTLNPFITQWSILTIRHLLENSPSNQDIVRGLQLRGSAYSSVLQEFGIQVSVSDDGSNAGVKIAPTQLPEPPIGSGDG